MATKKKSTSITNKDLKYSDERKPTLSRMDKQWLKDNTIYSENLFVKNKHLFVSPATIENALKYIKSRMNVDESELLNIYTSVIGEWYNAKVTISLASAPNMLLLRIEE